MCAPVPDRCVHDSSLVVVGTGDAGDVVVNHVGVNKKLHRQPYGSPGCKIHHGALSDSS